jgi:hypothetical protein
VKFEKAMDQIAATLLPGEVLTYGAEASMDDRNQSSFGKHHDRPAFVTGALAVTSTRLRFLGAMLLDRRDISVPLTAVTSIQPVQRRLIPYVLVTAAGVSHEFRTGYGQQFAAAAQQAITQPLGQAWPGPPPTG